VQDWTVEQVCQWLMHALDNHTEEYTKLFREHKVDGAKLLELSGPQMKQIGIVDAIDRDTLKRKLRELCAADKKVLRARQPT
jgi:hypothetical protein